LHIRANIEETHITRIKRGQRVIVTIDALGNREFTGYVSEIGKVTDAEITGNPMFFNTGGTFTKVVQLIPIKIIITDDIKLENYIGLNAKVKIDLTSTVSETAQRIETSENNATASRNVYTTLGQIIKRIDVKVGDTVREGQILCVFDADDLAYEVNIAEASLRTAEINFTMAEHNHEIRRSLYATGAVPRDEMRQLEFALQSAIASRQQAQAMLDVARLSLDRSIIRSPINGTVTAIFAREGAIGLGLLFVIEEGTSN
jgi:multidrug resistance efflux pump